MTFKRLIQHGVVASAILISTTAISAMTNTTPLYDSKALPPNIADTDKDGVINVRDFCTNTPLGASVDNDGCSSESTKLLSVNLQILFDTGKYDVKPIYYSEVKKLADFLKKNPNSSVVIEGHTDNVGQNDYNLNLSRNRANAIASVLVQKFAIASNRVQGVGYGEERPITSNDTPEGREQNRRVVAEVFAKRTAQVKRWNIYSVDTQNSTSKLQY